VGVRHLPRLDGISTGARPSVIVRTLIELIRFRRKYGRAFQATGDGAFPGDERRSL